MWPIIAGGVALGVGLLMEACSASVKGPEEKAKPAPLFNDRTVIHISALFAEGGLAQIIEKRAPQNGRYRVYAFFAESCDVCHQYLGTLNVLQRDRKDVDITVVDIVGAKDKSPFLLLQFGACRLLGLMPGISTEAEIEENLSVIRQKCAANIQNYPPQSTVYYRADPVAEPLAKAQ